MGGNKIPKPAPAAPAQEKADPVPPPDAPVEDTQPAPPIQAQPPAPQDDERKETRAEEDEEEEEEEEVFGTWCPPTTQPDTSSDPKGPGQEAAATAGDDNADYYQLEPWQEYQKGKGLICKCCNQCYDEAHAGTEKHKRRLADWEWAERSKEGMPAPKQPWLCWRSDPEYGYGLFLRCLLCQKWVQDCELEDTTNYDGDHGNEGDGNTKMHKKKLYNMGPPECEPWWPERLECHPIGGDARRPTAAAAAAPATRTLPQAAGEEPALPAGWFKYFDESGDPYYYTDAGLSQWEFPLEPAI